jgi:hypothetical protein
VTRNNKPVLFEVGHWNGPNLNNSVSTHERASLVPAAAVIPALVMYRIIVAVKKFVVGFSTVSRSALTGRTSGSVCIRIWEQSQIRMRITLNGLSAQGESSD